jgi:hypothetical protein
VGLNGLCVRRQSGGEADPSGEEAMDEADARFAIAAIRNADAILRSGFYNGVNGIADEAMFVLLMINAKDVLQRLSAVGQRISFRLDGETEDVTSLVAAVRDACCHLSSGNRRLAGGTEFAFNIVRGAGYPFLINGDRLGSDFEDDVALLYGKRRIYLRRHIEAALQLACDLVVGEARGRGWRL